MVADTIMDLQDKVVGVDLETNEDLDIDKEAGQKDKTDAMCLCLHQQRHVDDDNNTDMAQIQMWTTSSEGEPAWKCSVGGCVRRRLSVCFATAASLLLHLPQRVTLLANWIVSLCSVELFIGAAC